MTSSASSERARKRVSKIVAGGGQDEDAYRIRNLDLQLSRTLYVDVQQQVLALGLRALQNAPVRAVIVSETSACSRNSPRAMAASNSWRGDVVVVLAGPLFAARQPVVQDTEKIRPGSCCRSRCTSVDFPDPEGALTTNTMLILNSVPVRGSSRLPPLRLSASSAIFSPSSPPPVDFDRMVLVSRCISCSMKIELLADLPALGQQVVQLCRVNPEAGQLLADVGAVHQHRDLLGQALGSMPELPSSSASFALSRA